MNLMGLFRSPQNELEKGGKPVPEEDAGIRTTCPHCGVQLPLNDLQDNLQVCTACGYHFRMGPRDRIVYLVDEESFQELDGDLKSRDILGFPGYDQKLRNAKLASREKEGVVCGTAQIDGQPCALFFMDPNFMIGSMGTVVGEKITRLFEHATEHSLPVVGFTVSGGARMQEGILSLMQMAKTSAAVRRHSDTGNFYLTVLTDPTTGGRYRQLCHGRRRHHGGARGHHRLCRGPRHRADHPQKAARRVPKGGVPAGARLCGHHRPPHPAAGDHCQAFKAP